MPQQLKQHLSKVHCLTLNPVFRDEVLLFGCVGVVDFGGPAEFDEVCEYLKAREFPFRAVVLKRLEDHLGLEISDDPHIEQLFDRTYSISLNNARYFKGILVNNCTISFEQTLGYSMFTPPIR